MHLAQGQGKCMPAKSSTEEQLDWAIRQYKDNHRSVAAIAKELGVSSTPLHSGFTRRGIPRSQRFRTSKYGPNVVNEAVRLYDEKGLSASDVARELGIPDRTIRDLLRAQGLILRPAREYKFRFTEEEELEICAEFLNGSSKAEIGRKYHVDPATVQNILNRKEITLRRNPGVYLRKYTLNHAFFRTVDTEESAYWLGFIAADGAVTEQNHMCVSLAQKDEEHLKRLRASLDSTHPIPTYHYPGTGFRGGPRAQYTIYSPEMVQDLGQFGVVPNKTRSLTWPSRLYPSMWRHFIRGYVDGDGCWARQSNLSVCLRVEGNEPFLLAMQTILMEACSLRRTKLSCRRPGCGSRTLIYGGRLQVARIVRYLYEGATIFLPRKFARVEHFLPADEVASDVEEAVCR